MFRLNFIGRAFSKQPLLYNNVIGPAVRSFSSRIILNALRPNAALLGRSLSRVPSLLSRYDGSRAALSSRGGGFFDQFKSGLPDWIKIRAKAKEKLNQMSSGKNLTDQQLPEYVRFLVMVNPSEAVTFIENGWVTSQFPVNEKYVREYIKAVGAIKRLDSIQVCFDSLSTLYNSAFISFFPSN